MEVILENPSLFKKSIEIVSELVLEGTFVFKQDYVELVALNSNNVVMVIFKLLSTNFQKYEIKEETTLSLSLEHLNNVLKSCDDKSPLRLENSDSGKLKIVSEGKNKKEFYLSLIEYSDDNIQKIPSLNFPLKVITTSQNFSNAINDLSFIEEGIALKVDGKKFMIEGKTNSMQGKIEINEEVEIKNEEDKTYLCRYSMEYLKKFTKADKLVKTVELSFNNDYPLKIEYKLLDKLLLAFILAPRGEE